MHTMSVEIQPKMSVNIHNQCTDFNLVSSEYFSNDTYMNEHLDWEIDAGSMMNVDFKYSLAVIKGVISRQENMAKMITSLNQYVFYLS
jgi:hypothetical protein